MLSIWEHRYSYGICFGTVAALQNSIANISTPNILSCFFLSTPEGLKLGIFYVVDHDYKYNYIYIYIYIYIYNEKYIHIYIYPPKTSHICRTKMWLKIGSRECWPCSWHERLQHRFSSRPFRWPKRSRCTPRPEKCWWFLVGYFG